MAPRGRGWRLLGNGRDAPVLKVAELSGIPRLPGGANSSRRKPRDPDSAPGDLGFLFPPSLCSQLKKNGRTVPGPPRLECN